MDSFNARCSPPWSDRELAHKLDDARDKVQSAGEVGAMLREDRSARQAAARVRGGDEQGGSEQAGDEQGGSSTDLILDPTDPLPTAREFVARLHSATDGTPTLHSFNGDVYAWTGASYAAIPEDAVRAQLYKFLEPALRLEVRGDDQQLVSFKPTKGKLDNAVDALRGVSHLAAAAVPAWIGASGPDPIECIPVRNGILHEPTRRLLSPSPRFFNLNATDFDYNPDAPTPANWQRFLLSLWEADEQARNTLQEIFGLLLTLDTRHEKIFLIVGPKRSGKGTIARVLRALLGAANVCGPTLSGLSNHFGLESLIGKQLAIISDARLSGKADQSIIAERLLSVSGEDAIGVPRKHRPNWEGKLPTRFVVMTNELPRLSDASGALSSRFVVLTMSRSFYGQEDHGLTDRLLAELPGIFKWALEGLRRLRERGRFIQPDSSAGAIAELEALGSPVSAFVSERCVVAPGRSIQTTRLYELWRGWCEDEGREHPGTQATFGRDLLAAVPGIAKTRPRIGELRIQFYEGIDTQ